MLYRKILLPVDFSKTTEHLILWIETLNALEIEEIIILHVIESENEISIKKDEVITLQKLLSDKLANENISITTKITFGIPSREIVKLANKENVSIIIMGAQGKGIFKQMIVGSTAFNVVRMANIPTMIIKKNSDNNHLINAENSKLSVLFPIDFSKCSEVVFQTILSNPNMIENILLLSVVEKGEAQEEVESIKKDYITKLEKLKIELENLGIQVTIRVEEGIASKQIGKVELEENVDLIMMGMTGESFIEALLIGSTTEAVLRNSLKPILCIPCK